MVKTISIREEGQPYLVRVEDEDGRSIMLNSSRMNSKEFMSPGQMLASGLAGCMSMTVKGALFRAGVPYNDVSVSVEMDRDEDTKDVSFTYDISIDSDADPALVEKVKQEAAASCYVRGLLTSKITVQEKK